MNWPKISIITPSYNQDKFLRQTLESVLSQNYPNLQYIVIDGGSKDKSVEIIRDYADRLDYWVSESDEGQSDAINKGLSHADGEIVTWINSDDLLMPGSLHAVGQVWRRDPHLDLLSAACIRIGPDNEFFYWHCVPRQTMYFASHGVIYIDQPGTFWRRRFFECQQVLDTGCHTVMDHDLWYRIALGAGRNRRLRRCTGAIRIHESTKSSTIPEVFCREVADLRKRYCNGLEQVSGATTLAYRAWKCFTGDYLIKALYSLKPPRNVVRFLREIQTTSNEK